MKRPPAWWEVRRDTTGAKLLVELAAEHGVPAGTALRGTGMSEATLADPDVQIEGAQELLVTRNVVAELGDPPGLGVEAGRRYTLGAAGILGLALLSSPKVRDALLLGIRYAALSMSFLVPSLEEDGSAARLVSDDSGVPESVRAFVLEREFAATGQMMALLAGERVNERLVLELRVGAERGRALAGAVPIPVLELGRPRNVLVFPRSVLDARLPHADERTAEAAERQCAELLARRLERPGTTQLVLSRLLSGSGAPASMVQVARGLHMEPRTLRRHLAREGTSFRVLADETRRALSLELLASDLTIDEVSHRLGYSEAASFTHAFKRWYGLAPSVYRRRSSSTA